MPIMICPYCEKETLTKEVTIKEERKMRGVTVSYYAKHWKCGKCKEIYDDPKQVDYNLLAIREAYQEKVDNLTPSNIRAIREQYNASIRAFAILLGIEEDTLRLYEEGRKELSKEHRLLLMLANSPKVFNEIYQRNSFKIGNIQRDNITSSKKLEKRNSN